MKESLLVAHAATVFVLIMTPTASHSSGLPGSGISPGVKYESLYGEIKDTFGPRYLSGTSAPNNASAFHRGVDFKMAPKTDIIPIHQGAITKIIRDTGKGGNRVWVKTGPYIDIYMHLFDDTPAPKEINYGNFILKTITFNVFNPKKPANSTVSTCDIILYKKDSTALLPTTCKYTPKTDKTGRPIISVNIGGKLVDYKVSYTVTNVVGPSGNSGGVSPHLHLSTKFGGGNGKYINPMAFVDRDPLSANKIIVGEPYPNNVPANSIDVGKFWLPIDFNEDLALESVQTMGGYFYFDYEFGGLLSNTQWTADILEVPSNAIDCEKLLRKAFYPSVCVYPFKGKSDASNPKKIDFFVDGSSNLAFRPGTYYIFLSLKNATTSGLPYSPQPKTITIAQPVPPPSNAVSILNVSSECQLGTPYPFKYRIIRPYGDGAVRSVTTYASSTLKYSATLSVLADGIESRTITPSHTTSADYLGVSSDGELNCGAWDIEKYTQDGKTDYLCVRKKGMPLSTSISGKYTINNPFDPNYVNDYATDPTQYYWFKFLTSHPWPSADPNITVIYQGYGYINNDVNRLFYWNSNKQQTLSVPTCIP